MPLFFKIELADAQWLQQVANRHVSDRARHQYIEVLDKRSSTFKEMNVPLLPGCFLLLPDIPI